MNQRHELTRPGRDAWRAGLAWNFAALAVRLAGFAIGAGMLAAAWLYVARG